MKAVEVILWASDGYDGANWESTLKISDSDYSQFIKLAKEYEFDKSEIDYSFDPNQYAVMEYEDYTNYLCDNAPGIYGRLMKKATKLIAESFDANKDRVDYMEYDIDNFNIGYYIKLEWLVQIIENR